MSSSSLIAVSTFRSTADAQVAKGILDEAGIESMVRADNAGGMYPAMGGAELLVRSEDVEKAHDALAGFGTVTSGVQSVAMKQLWTIIGVRDVASSLKWYQSLFGQPETAPSHSYFAQLLDADGTVLLSLHAWGAHEHPSLTSPERATPGNGLLLFFRVDDFDLTLQTARGLVTKLDEEPHSNPNTRTQEFSLRDPDGYYVTISAL